MPIAQDFHQPAPGLSLWQAYDPSVKADLFSTALSTPSGLYLIDPIPLPADRLDDLVRTGPPRAVIVTNANHHRAAADYAKKFSIPIIDRKGQPGASGVDLILIDGAAEDEMAVYYPGNGGTLVVGDALINFQPYGFTFLPRKYCTNEREMRRSLRQLLDLKIQRIFFAHGMPILHRAAEQLKALIES